MIFSTIVSFQNWEDDMRDFINSFDEDASGRNGLNYIDIEAKNNKYDNSTDYWINEANKNIEENNIEDKIDFVLKKLDNTYSSYDYHDYKIDSSAEDFLIVIFAEQYSV